MKNCNTQNKTNKGAHEQEVVEEQANSISQTSIKEEERYIWKGSLDKIAVVSLVNIDSDGSLSSNYSMRSSRKDNNNKKRDSALGRLNRQRARAREEAKVREGFKSKKGNGIQTWIQRTLLAVTAKTATIAKQRKIRRT